MISFLAGITHQRPYENYNALKIIKSDMDKDKALSEKEIIDYQKSAKLDGGESQSPNDYENINAKKLLKQYDYDYSKDLSLDELKNMVFEFFTNLPNIILF